MEDNPDLAIFLDANFYEIRKRIFSRGRERLKLIILIKMRCILKVLHQLYKELFIKLCTYYKIPYYIIDTNSKNDQLVLYESKKIIDKFDFSNSHRYTKY
ncbi:hypothetical protein ONA22_00445 [Mycoplasmopsis cynos]|nr:hypothetical protein [Mycoplasmopsis cynos]WAM04043.1 hypothetical protein ONA22_00445 [Mycoplasmopsis cynos]